MNKETWTAFVLMALCGAANMLNSFSSWQFYVILLCSAASGMLAGWNIGRPRRAR